MNLKELEHLLEIAEEEVAKIKKDIENEKFRLIDDNFKNWPAWKQNILTDSSKPNWSTPRKPVAN